MIRNAKVLGLALVAIFAMSAVAASMASAAEETKPGLFTASGVAATETAVISGGQTAEGKDTFTLNGLTLTCKTATLSGGPVKTIAEGKTEPQPGSESTDITLSPTYDGCHVVIAGLTKTVTVTTNGCAFIFDAKTTVTEVGFDHTATVTIECPTGKQIEIHVYNEKEAEATTLCTYDVKPQGPLSGITLTNKVNTPKPANDVTAIPNVTVAVVNTKLSALCGEKEATTAVYKGEDTITAKNGKGEEVDASVSD